MVFNSAFYGLLTCKIWFLVVTVYGRDFSRKTLRIWLEDLRTPGDGSWNIQKNTGAVSVSFVKDSPPSVKTPALWQQSFLFFSRANGFFFWFEWLWWCVKNQRSVQPFTCYLFSSLFSPICMNKVRIYISSLKTPFLWGERWRGKDDHWWIEAVQIPRHFSGCYHNLKTDRTSKWIDQCR